MLVLSRKDGERILIGDDIEIILVQSKDGRSRIGVNAPLHTRIKRAELGPQEKEKKHERND